MSAIITDTFRRANAKAFVEDIRTGATNKYYIGIGKSDAYDVYEDTTYPIPAATGGYTDSLEVLNNLNTLKRITGTGSDDTAKLAIPNVALVSGKKYKTYDSHDSSCFLPDTANNILPCYGVRTVSESSSFLYMCVAKTAITTTLGTLPTDTSAYTIATVASTDSTGTSYWVLVQEIVSPASDSFIIVRDSVLTSGTTPTAATVKSAAGGAVVGLHVITGGKYAADAVLTGYLYLSDDTTGGVTPTHVVAIPTGNITTVTTGASKTITAVALPNLGTWQYGATKGNVRIVSTTATAVDALDYPAIISPIIAPLNGFGYLPSTVMPTWFASLETTLNGNIDGDSLLNSYRQISVVKNPTGASGAGPATYNASKYLTTAGVSGDAGLLVEGALLCQTIAYTSGATGAAGDNLNGRLKVVGVVDKYDSGANKLYYHQNYSTGFNELALGSTTVAVGTITPKGVITLTGTVVTYSNSSVGALDNAEIKDDPTTYSRGEVLFVENRKRITRSDAQSEKVKIIIQF